MSLYHFHSLSSDACYDMNMVLTVLYKQRNISRRKLKGVHFQLESVKVKETF